MRALAVSLIVLAGLIGPVLGWSQYAETDRTGVIHKVELGAQSVIISGMRYRVAIDAHVEIDGTYGAFSMLREGMRVRFVCTLISPEEREIVRLETLPAGFVLEDA